MMTHRNNLAAVVICLLLLLSVPAVLSADIVYLNTGGKLEGKILTRDPDSGVKIRTINGTVELAADDIDRIEECESVFDLYERKLKETPKGNSEARFKLATWCKENGLRAEAKKHFEEVYEQKLKETPKDDSEARFRLAVWCKKNELKTEAKKHFKEVIALSPDHEKARAELGYIKTAGGWEVASPPKRKPASDAQKKKKQAALVEKKAKDKKKERKERKKRKTPKPAKPGIKVIPAGCNVHILWCSKTREAVLIDAGGGANEVFQYLEQNKLKLTKIIITHGHGDHVGAVPNITSKISVEVLAHQNAPRFRGLTKTVKDGDTIKVGTLTLKVIHTPGHSPGSMCLFLKSGKMLFAGDTLFKDGIGRTANRAALIGVIKEKLLDLGDDVVVYPGHGASTTIGAEKKYFR